MLAGRTILVVQGDAATHADDPTARADHSFTVVAVGTLQEAEKLLSDGSVCIGAVILDFESPRVTWCVSCARIRQRGA